MRTWGEKRRKLPQRGPGQRPGRKWIFIIILGQKEATSGTPVFLSDGEAPKRRGARENFPLFPPLDGPARLLLDTRPDGPYRRAVVTASAY